MNKKSQLQTKLLLLYAGSAILITAVLGGILYATLWKGHDFRPAISRWGRRTGH